jgi:hypothetical protein
MQSKRTAYFGVLILNVVSTLSLLGGCIPLPGQSPPVLFVANPAGNKVTGFKNPRALDGNVAPATNLAGPKTQLDGPHGLFLLE